MRASLSSRVLSLALSLWLPLFMSGAESIVRCPTHDGSVASTSQVTADGSGQSADHDHGAGHSTPTNGAGHSCLCPGPGCCPPAVAVVPGTVVPLGHIVAVHAAVAVSTLDRLASRTDHLLPFATAPPAVALAPATSHVA